MHIGLKFLISLSIFSVSWSILFKTTIESLSARFVKKPLKSTLFGSNIISFKSASSALLRARFIPLFSISSLEFRIPAVSDKITGYPSKLR